MRLIYSEPDNNWLVIYKGKTTPLRDVYIEARQKSGKNVTRLENEMRLPNRALYYHEHNYQKTQRPNMTVGLMLRALQHLGYKIDIGTR